MKKGTKAKQIVVRFSNPSYEKIREYALREHRGLGEFVRHATLSYIENLDEKGRVQDEKGGKKL